jgi:hypothetical protein
MTFPRQKIVTIALLAVIGLLLWECWSLKGSIVWTGFITFEAEDARKEAQFEAKPQAVVYALDFYLGYYRAHIGSVRERHLIQIIERDKRQTVEQVLTYLRKATGEDLGDDPEKWIAKYSKE